MLIGLAAGYLVVGSLLLTFTNYRWSLAGWLTAEFSHLYFIQESLSTCRLSRWLEPVEPVCRAAEDGGILILAAPFLGILLALSFGPADFPPVNRRARRAIFSLGGLSAVALVLAAVAGVIVSMQRPSFGWVPLEVEGGPGPLQDGEAAFDARRNRLVIFGGSTGYIGDNRWAYVNETWEWDGRAWVRTTPQARPPGRLDHALAYDEERGVVVLFGGLGDDGRLSDTWEWDGTRWMEMHPETSPAGRSGHEMVYDPARRKVVLYGGYSDPAFYNDAWEWDGETWRSIDLEGSPPVASVFALASNPAEGYVLGLLSGTPGGTWIWQEDAWTQLHPSREPSNRASTTLVHDSRAGFFLTFGGVAGSETVSDTWIFESGEWTEYTRGGIHPSDRSDMTIWYDPLRGHVLLYGGRDSSTVYDDLWEFIPPGD